MRRVMTTRLRSVPDDEPTPERPAPDSLLERAAELGFELVSFPTATEQTVWEWRQGDGPRPQFVTERVARHWMSEWLASHPDPVRPEPLDQRRRARNEQHDAPRTVADTA
jgi:hypothetical protein